MKNINLVKQALTDYRIKLDIKDPVSASYLACILNKQDQLSIYKSIKDQGIKANTVYSILNNLVVSDLFNPIDKRSTY